jgi:hypothetical protein
MSIELTQGVPPLTAPELMRVLDSIPRGASRRHEAVAVLARYGVECEEGVHWLFEIDEICQQAARAQEAEAELAQLKTINDFGRVPPSCTPEEVDAGIDALAAGGHVWDGKESGQWQRELRGDRPWHEQPNLRDLFAMHAPECFVDSLSLERAAKLSYEWADAMIAASSRGVQAKPDTQGDLV